MFILGEVSVGCMENCPCEEIFGVELALLLLMMTLLPLPLLLLIVLLLEELLTA